jgi:nucleotide-binding universal stress UspA family protein
MHYGIAPTEHRMAFERILVPVDFSPTSREAVRLAASMARRGRGRLTLLHVGAMPTSAMVFAWSPSIHETAKDLHARMAAASKSLVEEWLLAEAGDGVEARALLREGFPPEQIVDEARDHDLLVIGTHGNTGIDRVLLGSVAERVVRHSPIPVLVATGTARGGGAVAPRFERILVAIDFSDASVRALRLAVSVARAEGGSVSVVHVGVAPAGDANDPWTTAISPAIQDLAARMAAETAHRLERLVRDEVPEVLRGDVLVREGSPPTAIVEQVRAGHHDVVVMGTHGHTGLERALLGSVAERVLRHSPVPVLVTR